MAIKVNRTTAFERWEDAKFRLLAQFSDKRIPFREDFHIRFCDLNVEVDDFSICLDGKRHLFHSGGPGADKLCDAVKNGAKPCLVYTHVFNKEPELSIVDKRDMHLLSVVGRDSEAELQLPRVLEDILLDYAVRDLPKLYRGYNVHFNNAMQSIFDKQGVLREDIVSLSIATNLVMEKDMIEPEGICNNLLFFDSEEINTIKSNVETCIKELFETDGSSLNPSVQDLVFSKFEKCFSSEYLFEGWLSLQVAQLGEFRGEVQTDDIARVASWALRDPEYRSYGDKIREWADAEAGRYNLKSGIVAKKQEKMVGPLVDNTPVPIKSVRKSLSVKF